jgi:hypothetical protein
MLSSEYICVRDLILTKTQNSKPLTDLPKSWPSRTSSKLRLLILEPSSVFHILVGSMLQQHVDALLPIDEFELFTQLQRVFDSFGDVGLLCLQTLTTTTSNRREYTIN